MASRYPLVVNTNIPRLEELKGIDDLNLSQSGIELSNGFPSALNDILRYNGTELEWVSGDTFIGDLGGFAGVARLNELQTLTNKTLSGLNNTFTDIPNSALVNDYITFGTQQVFLGDTINAIDTDTKYEITALGAGLNRVDFKLNVYDLNNNITSNPTPNGDTSVRLEVAGDLTLGYNNSTKTITITSTFVDTNTTYSASGTGGLTTSGQSFLLKNSGTFSANNVLKWDDTNNQFTNSTLTDTGALLSTTIPFQASTLKSTGGTTIGEGSGAITLTLRSGNNISRQRASIQAVMSTSGTTPSSSSTLFYDHITGTGNNSSWKIIDEDGTTGSVAHIQATAVPASATSAGRPGQVRFDATHIYFCTAENTWIRALRAAF